jgi:predicted ester cyclase
MNPRAAATAQIAELWGHGDFALIDRLYAPDCIDHMPEHGRAPGRAGLRAAIEGFYAAFSDIRMTLDGVLAKGDTAVDWWTLDAVHTGAFQGHEPTGRAVRFSGIDMIRVDQSGRIAELWHVEEMLALEAQLGVAPPDLGAPLLPGEQPPPQPAAADPGAEARVPGLEALSETERRNLVLGRRHIEDMWAKGHAELGWELYAPDIVDRNPAPGQRPGIAGILELIGGLREAISDLDMRVQTYLVDSDRVVDRWVMRGMHTGKPLLGIPARGRPFDLQGMDISRFRDDGLIDEVFHVEAFAQARRALLA